MNFWLANAFLVMTSHVCDTNKQVKASCKVVEHSTDTAPISIRSQDIKLEPIAAKLPTSSA